MLRDSSCCQEISADVLRNSSCKKQEAVKTSERYRCGTTSFQIGVCIGL